MNRHLTHRDDLPLFMPTNNAGETAAVRFRKAFTSGPEPKQQTPTKHQQGVQAKVIAHLKQHGGIDALSVQKLGTTDARKIFSRLRDKGYLYAADDPAGHEERPNASGQGTYRWHR
jgi:hypothetical protein